MLALIRSNIEARYLSRSPGSNDLILDEQEHVCARGVYLNQGQQFRHDAHGAQTIIHVLQGVGEIILENAPDELEKEQLLKGDLVILSPQTSLTITSVTSSLLIASVICITQ